MHRRIPASKPWYNGAVECGIKEFKNLFYCLWREHGMPQSADEENDLLLRVKRVVKLTQCCMNEDMPRPTLGGVTPGARRSNQERETISENRRYQEQQERKEVKPWQKTALDLAREAVAASPLSNLRIMTDFCFFLKCEMLFRHL